MRQKIVVKVQMNCQKCRAKALKVVADLSGVDFLGLGAERDRVVVIGNGVDVVKLTVNLKKKLGYADIISVEPVNPS